MIKLKTKNVIWLESPNLQPFRISSNRLGERSISIVRFNYLEGVVKAKLKNRSKTIIFDDIGHGRWSWSDGPIHENSKFSLKKKLLQFGILNKIDQKAFFSQNVENFGKNSDLVSSRHRDIDFSKLLKTFVCASNLPSKLRIN